MEGETNTPSILIIGTENAVNLSDPDNQDGTNELLSEITSNSLAPIAFTYERIRQTLMGLGYTLPSALERSVLLSDTEGEEVFSLCLPDIDRMYLYFAFVQEDDKSVEVFAEIVNANELKEILDADVQTISE